MKILEQQIDTESQAMRVLTDESRYPIEVPSGIAFHYRDRHNIELAIRGFVMVELARRKANSLFPAGRHEKFMGFRA